VGWDLGRLQYHSTVEFQHRVAYTVQSCLHSVELPTQCRVAKWYAGLDYSAEQAELLHWLI